MSNSMSIDMDTRWKIFPSGNCRHPPPPSPLEKAMHKHFLTFKTFYYLRHDAHSNTFTLVLL